MTERVGVAFDITKFPALAAVKLLYVPVSVGAKSAVIAYVETVVGTVEDPLYLILLAIPILLCKETQFQACFLEEQ